MHRAILGIWAAAAFGAVLSSGCGGESSHRVDPEGIGAEGTPCERTVSKLRGCGFVSDGDTRCETAVDIPCATECLLASTCAEIEPYFCGVLGPEGSVADCVAKCEFQCADGTHIAEGARCNGSPDCGDSSDEDGCPGFSCDDGGTVPESYRCDGQVDCADDSDESGCTPFVCGGGEEVPSAWKCDGEEDCPDGSDEAGCPKRATLTCPEPQAGADATCSEEFAKLRSCGVISEGSTGCQASSSLHACESGCYVRAACEEVTSVLCDPSVQEGTLLECLQICAITQVVLCADGEEVRGGAECDGFIQCADQSDEVGCPAFTCASGDLIAVPWECDGMADCPDGSDEVGCQPFATLLCDGAAP